MVKPAGSASSIACEGPRRGVGKRPGEGSRTSALSASSVGLPLLCVSVGPMHDRLRWEWEYLSARQMLPMREEKVGQCSRLPYMILLATCA